MVSMTDFDVEVKLITGWEHVLDAARFTINKADLNKEPSAKFKNGMLLAEHSPIRFLQFQIDLKNIPSWVSQHLARHDAFAMHTVRDAEKETHFVGTSRTDRTGVDRSQLPQDAPVNHRIFCNANDLINISQKRLCSCASPETRAVWKKVKEEIAKIAPEVADKMVRTCIYRGFCPEINSCGFDKNEPLFTKMLTEYRKRE
jgi:hypothetical protein